MTPAFPRPPAVPRAALALALLGALLSGCRYTTFPLVPAQLTGEFPTRLTAGGLERAGPELVLNVTLDPRGRAGYLTVAWFREDAEIGRDSVFLDPGQPSAAFRLRAEGRGEYRAVVGFEGTVLRQFEFVDDAPTPPAAPTRPAAPTPVPPAAPSMPPTPGTP